jgi:uncharacterized membrane protein HdeD (DUF308 family)
MTSNAGPSDASQDTVGVGAQSLVWWLFLTLGVLWILVGMYVQSFGVGSLAAVTALVGVAFLYGGVTELAAASWVRTRRWPFIVGGILALAAGILTFVWPGITLYVVAILLAWYLIIFGVMHLISALAGPKVSYWWTQLLLGVAELVLGVWAVRSWEGSLLTLLTLVGVWAIFYGVAEIFAAFSVRQVGRRAERLLGRQQTDRASTPPVALGPATGAPGQHQRREEA